MTCAHEWEQDAQGFIRLSNGAKTCARCGHVEATQISPADAAYHANKLGGAPKDASALPGMGKVEAELLRMEQEKRERECE